MTASEHAKLLRIAYRTVLTYGDDEGKNPAHQILDTYQRFVRWKVGLSLEIASISNDTLPHVLCLQ